MANAYSKIYLQLVFAVKYKQTLLDKSWRYDLFSYMSKSLTARGHFALAVGGYSDHVHLFFDYSGKELIPDLVREIKKSSNQFIMSQHYVDKPFSWQGGYGVFSHGRREKDMIIKYIKNQDRHHSKKNKFKEEYLSLLHKYDIDYNADYLFEFREDD